MLVARVVHHEVRDDPDSSPVGVLHHRRQILEAAELGRDGHEVAYVVAAVMLGRGIERQQPQAVDPEPLEIFELLLQALEVADPVRVRVVEASRQELVEHGALVPSWVVQPLA